MAKKISVILSFAIFIFMNPFIASGAGEASEAVKAFLNNLEDAVYEMNTYRYIMIAENWKGSLHEKRTTRFQFKKPNLMRMDVLKGRKRRNVVVLNKRGKIRGKNSWGFRRTLKPTDRRIGNIRGTTFLEASLSDKLERIKEYILKRGCKATLREEEYAGRPAYYLHIDRKDKDDPITAEDLWFDKKTYTILRNLKYEDDKKVSDTAWQAFEINIPLDDSLFKL